MRSAPSPALSLRTIYERAAAELLGTFGLVLGGTTACVIDEVSGGTFGVIGIAIAFTLVVAAMVRLTGRISGGHLNPAVTLALCGSGRADRSLLLPYLIAQVLGAVVASLVVRILLPTSGTLGATLPAGRPWAAFAWETLLTFLLMFVIIHPVRSSRIPMFVAVGSTVGLEALIAGPITGASMNPARSLAPALVSGHVEHLWIYLTAPFLGALLALYSARSSSLMRQGR